MLISGAIFKMLQTPVCYIPFLSSMPDLFRVQWSHTILSVIRLIPFEARQGLWESFTHRHFAKVASWFLWHCSETRGSRRVVLILPLPQSTPALMTKYRAAQNRLWLWSWCPWALVLKSIVLFCLASVNLFGGDPAGHSPLWQGVWVNWFDFTSTSALFFLGTQEQPT